MQGALVLLLMITRLVMMIHHDPMMRGLGRALNNWQPEQQQLMIRPGLVGARILGRGRGGGALIDL